MSALLLKQRIAELERWQQEAYLVLAGWKRVEDNVRATVEASLGRNFYDIVLERLEERNQLKRTLRIDFTKAALQGILADPEDRSGEALAGETCHETAARLAVLHADAAITQLCK